MYLLVTQKMQQIVLWSQLLYPSQISLECYLIFFFLTVSYCKKYLSKFFDFLAITLMLHLYKQLICGQGCYVTVRQISKGRFLQTVQSFSLQNTGTASKALLWNDPQPLLIPESPAGIITRLKSPRPQLPEVIKAIYLDGQFKANATSHTQSLLCF